MKRTNIALALTATAAMLSVAACGGGSDPLSTGGSSTKSDSKTVVVGSADFAESTLLAQIYAGALKAKGVNVDTKLNIGSREVYLAALKDGSIDLIPEYTGNLLTYFNKDATASAPDEVYAALQKAVPANLTVLDKAAAEDTDSVAVTKATAQKYHLQAIPDLSGHAKDMVMGGPPEFKTRVNGLPGLKRVYGLDFSDFRGLKGQALSSALKNGQVDAANIFTTDPSIKQYGFVVLDDPKKLFPAQNVVPLITKDKASDTVTKALNAVSAKLTTDTLATLVKEVVIDKKDAADVAKSFLSTNSLG